MHGIMGMNWEGRNVGVYGHTLLVEESYWKGRPANSMEEERGEKGERISKIFLFESESIRGSTQHLWNYLRPRGTSQHEVASHPARPPIVSSWGSWRLKLSFNLSSHVREGPINGDFLSKGKIQPIAYFASFTLLHSLFSRIFRSFHPEIRATFL